MNKIAALKLAKFIKQAGGSPSGGTPSAPTRNAGAIFGASAASPLGLRRGLSRAGYRVGGATGAGRSALQHLHPTRSPSAWGFLPWLGALFGLNRFMDDINLFGWNSPFDKTEDPTERFLEQMPELMNMQMQTQMMQDMSGMLR